MPAKGASRISQACVACKRRKVKCDGQQDCKQCTALSLKCIYVTTSPTARSRRSTVRGHVIERCKLLEEDTSPSDPTAPRQTSTSLSPVAESSNLRAGALFPITFFEDLVEDYSSYVLPMLPIISEAEFRYAISTLNYSSTHLPLVYSLAAQTINATRTHDSPAYSTNVISLYTEALTQRKPVLSHDHVSVHSIMVSVLSSVGLFADHRDIDMGFYYVSEAISGIQVLHVDDQEKQTLLSVRERSQRERLHWLLFIHERFHAIDKYRPVLLRPLPHLPQPDDSLPANIQEGFILLIGLFRVIDIDFITNWRDRQSHTLTIAWVEKKQLELGDNVNRWSQRVETLQDMQQVDLIVTQCWLRTLVWQMALAKFVLTSTEEARREFMSLAFPIRLSHRLRTLLASKPRQAVEVHGTGILLKIFDIACTAADLLEHLIVSSDNAEVLTGYLDDFLFLHAFLIRMSKFYNVERVILASKLETMQVLFPTTFAGQYHSPDSNFYFMN